MDPVLTPLLFLAAIAPSAILMFFVYRMDRVEKEPIGLIARVFAVGAGVGLVAGVVEGIMIGALEAMFPQSILLLLIEYFICVAVVEELGKYLALNTIRTNPEFNYVFDGIVYAVAAALGFATLENVFYVLEGGFETAALRALLSVPGHCADGVVMGVFFGLARQREVAGNFTGARRYYWLAFLLPVIEHGLYDSALSIGTVASTLLAIAVDIAFIIVAGVIVFKTSKGDTPIYPVNPLAFRQYGEFDMNAPVTQYVTYTPYGAYANGAPMGGMPVAGAPVVGGPAPAAGAPQAGGPAPVAGAPQAGAPQTGTTQTGNPAPVNGQPATGAPQGGMPASGVTVQTAPGMSTMPGMPMMPSLGFGGSPVYQNAPMTQGTPPAQGQQQMYYYQQPMAGQQPMQPMAGQPQQQPYYQQPTQDQRTMPGQQQGQPPMPSQSKGQPPMRDEQSAQGQQSATNTQPAPSDQQL